MKCPICNARVKELSINTHIDNGCQSPPPISTTVKSKKPPSKKKPSDDAKNQWNKLFSGKVDAPAPKTSKGGGKGKEKEKSMCVTLHRLAPVLKKLLIFVRLIGIPRNACQRSLTHCAKTES